MAFIEGNLSSEERAKIDAGERARAKLEFRQRAMRKAKLLCLGVLGMFVVLLCSGAVFGYHQYQDRKIEWQVDYKECYLQLGNTVVEARRKYRYQSTSLLGFRFIDTSTMQEETELRGSGLAFTLVGHSDKDWWSIRNESNATSRNYTKLKPATIYTFVSAHHVGVVEYEAFCKNPRPMEL